MGQLATIGSFPTNDNGDRNYKSTLRTKEVANKAYSKGRQEIKMARELNKIGKIMADLVSVSV
jgi:hypothetical protein